MPLKPVYQWCLLPPELLSGTVCPSKVEFALEIRLQFIDLYPDLVHRIPVPYSDTGILQRIEIECDAVRCTYLILSSVPFAYAAGLIILADIFSGQPIIYLERLFAKLL